MSLQKNLSQYSKLRAGFCKHFKKKNIGKEKSLKMYFLFELDCFTEFFTRDMLLGTALVF